MMPSDQEIAAVTRATGMGRVQAIRHLKQREQIRQAAPMGHRSRVSSDSAWPLRGVDGLTFAERRAQGDGI